MTQIDTLFDRMDSWRHFPNYQLEGRADIYFALYLPEVLEARLGVPLSPRLIPEFPVRIGMIDPDTPTNRAYTIDYVALTVARDKAILVELNTDGRSRSVKQDRYLLAAQNVGFHQLLEGLLDIFRATTAKRQYFYLLQHLEKMDLLRIPALMYEIMRRPTLQGVTEASRQIKVEIGPLQSQIVYVQPGGEGRDVITFGDFAEIVRKHDDPISRRFGRSLLEWAEVPAGER